MAWPKRSAGGVRQWVLTMANALVDRGHGVDVLTETPRWKFVDEPMLDPRVGRVTLGKLFARRRLDAYVRAHPACASSRRSTNTTSAPRSRSSASAPTPT